MNQRLETLKQWFSVIKRMLPWIILAVFVCLLGSPSWPLGPQLIAPQLIVPLLMIAGLILAGFAGYKFLSRSPSLDSALLDSHYERFRRLEGLYHTIPVAVRKNSASQDLLDAFEALCDRLEKMVEPKTRDFTQNDAADFVHNLTLLFFQIVPQYFLMDQLETVRREYRDLFGAAVYESHVAAVNERLKDAPKDGALLEQFFRAEATYLLNETRRYTLLEMHVETTRQKLMKAAIRSWWYNIIPFLAILTFFLFCQACIEHAVNPGGAAGIGGSAGTTGSDWSVEFARDYLIKDVHKEDGKPPTVTGTTAFQALIAAAMLSLVGMAGASGGMLSVIQRVQTADGNADASADLRALSQSEASVLFAPATGVMFSFVLSAMFAGGVVRGDMFPDPDKASGAWFMTLWNSTNMAKWLVWGFLAGFSERLVPDMLNGVAKNSTERPATTPSTSSQAALSTLSLAANPPPVLDAHPVSIAANATEVTITGKGFSEKTALVLGGSNKPLKIQEVTASKIRFEIAPADLTGKNQIVITAKNPSPGGGEASLPISVVG